jgi:hypothetical protein
MAYNSGPNDPTAGSTGDVWTRTTTPTTIWRKNANGAWYRGYLNVFNIQDYGALCNGSDDTVAWQQAIAAAHTANGVVFHPGGVSGITLGLVIPTDSSVQIVGGPGAIIRALTGFPGATPMLKIDTTPGFAGSRFGAIRDIRFEGGDANNRYADIGLRVFGVQREFENIVITRCKSQGLLVHGAQNCTFLSCQFEGNGSNGTSDANCVIERGAGNNLFDRCQFTHIQNSTNGYLNLLITQNGAKLTDTFSQPEANTFVGCQFERSSQPSPGSVLQVAGRNNTFVSCTFVVTGSRYCVCVSSAGEIP